jgi:hypothetical protein
LVAVVQQAAMPVVMVQIQFLALLHQQVVAVVALEMEMVDQVVQVAVQLKTVQVVREQQGKVMTEQLLLAALVEQVAVVLVRLETLIMEQ